MDTFEGSVWSLGDEDVLRELRLSRQAIREVLRDLTVALWSGTLDAGDEVRRNWEAPDERA